HPDLRPAAGASELSWGGHRAEAGQGRARPAATAGLAGGAAGPGLVRPSLLWGWRGHRVAGDIGLRATEVSWIGRKAVRVPRRVRAEARPGHGTVCSWLDGET